MSSQPQHPEPIGAAQALDALGGATTREEVAQRLLERADELEGQPQGSAKLRALRGALASAPVLTLYTASPLSDTAVEPIARWCRREIDPALVLDLKLDPAAAGGCLIAWRGVLHDYSFSARARKHEAELTALIERILSGAPAQS